MTNLERLEKTRQLEKLKRDLHFYEDVSPALNLVEVVCGGLAGLLILDGVLGFAITAGNIVGTAVCMAVIFSIFQKDNKTELQKIKSQINQQIREFHQVLFRLLS